MIIFVVDLTARLDNFDFGSTTLNLQVVSLAVALQGGVSHYIQKKGHIEDLFFSSLKWAVPFHEC